MISFNEELKEWYNIYEYVKDMYDTLSKHKDEIDEDIYKILYNRVFSNEINERLQKIYPFEWLDPDARFEDDFLAWYSKLESEANIVEKMIKDKL